MSPANLSSVLGYHTPKKEEERRRGGRKRRNRKKNEEKEMMNELLGVFIRNGQILSF